jgi:cell shape-determining protein MreD
MGELRTLAAIFRISAYIGSIIGFTTLFFAIFAIIAGEKETAWMLFPTWSISLSAAVGCKLSQIGVKALNYIVEAARKYTNK